MPCDRGAFLAGLPWGHVMDGVDHWWFRDGLAQRYRADHDAPGLTVQLGLSPAPGSHTQHVSAAVQRLTVKRPRRRR
jgi:hypothetical protein